LIFQNNKLSSAELHSSTFTTGPWLVVQKCFEGTSWLLARRLSAVAPETATDIQEANSSDYPDTNIPTKIESWSSIALTPQLGGGRNQLFATANLKAP